MIVYILTILLFTITFLPQIRNNNRFKTVSNKLNDFRFINSFLLIWIIIGFFTRLDFSQMMGDIIGGEKIFDFNNIGFSSISFILILIARFSINARQKTISVLIELIIWLIRFFYYKGGYAMGFAANYPLDLIVLYDTTGIFLRLKIIDNINPLKFLKQCRIYIIVFLFVSLKIFLLPIPHDLFWETKRINKKTEQTKALLIGNWNGIVDYDSTWVDTIATYRLDTITLELKIFFEPGADRIQIDSTHKYALKDMRNLISDSVNISITQNMIITTDRIDCYMDFQYYDWGRLVQKDRVEYGSFKIWNVNKDSLVFTVTEGFNKNYKYKLTKNNAW